MLVIGLGRFGQHLASNLLDLGNDVMIIDSDERKLEGLVPYATSSKIGDCTNPEVLRSLGIGNFDVIFICIGTNFQSSLEITSLVKEMGGKHVVSKATRDIQAKFLLRNGADEVIYPEKDIAERCAARFSMDNVFDYIEISSKYGIYEISPLKEWVGTVSYTHLDVYKRQLITRARFPNISSPADPWALKSSLRISMKERPVFPCPAAPSGMR